VQVNSGGGATSGGSATISTQGRSTFGNLLAIGMLIGMSYGDAGERGVGDAPPPARVPDLDPARRVLMQDCTKPIVDWSANLRCR